MNKKILLISSHSFEGVDSFDWFQELPNISDYDIVILDTPRIFTFWSLAGRLEQLGNNEYLLSETNQIDEKVRSNLDLVRKKLLEILEFNVAVYALYIPHLEVRTLAEYYHEEVGSRGKSTRVSESRRIDFVDINDWRPITISTFAEKGHTILIKDNSYEGYFRDFDNWQYYFVPDSLSIKAFEYAYSSKWAVTAELNIIATNKVDKPIAIEFIPQFHEWSNAEDGAWYTTPVKGGGSLVLLPVPDPCNTEPFIEILLNRTKVFEKTPPPSWTNTVEISGEGLLKNEIATERKKLEATQSKVTELESKLEELEKYKGLLWETGLTLQELVRSTLEKLGAAIERPPVSDVLISMGGSKALIEVKGNSKSILKDDVAQLVTDLMQHSKTTGQEIDGILIGNGWRLLPVKERGTGGKPIFSRDAIRVAQNHNIGLISTTELYKAFCKTLEEPQYKKEVLDKVMGKGVITF